MVKKMAIATVSEVSSIIGYKNRSALYSLKRIDFIRLPFPDSKELSSCLKACWETTLRRLCTNSCAIESQQLHLKKVNCPLTICLLPRKNLEAFHDTRITLRQ